MKRSGPLARTTPLRRRSRPRSAQEREAAAAWARGLALAVDAVDGMPGSRNDPIEGHHVVPKSVIKKLARSRGWSRERTYLTVWDPRNRMPVRRSRHDLHTRAIERIPRSFVPESALAFARELGLLHVIERDYPDPTEGENPC